MSSDDRAAPPEEAAPGRAPGDTTVAERLAALEATVDAQADRIENLEARLVAERDRREALVTVRGADATDADLGNIFVAGVPLGSIIDALRAQQDRHADRLDDLEAALEEGLADRREERAHGDAKLRRRITAVAENAGVEVTDADLRGDDMIKRVLTHGVDAITTHPSATEHRAADLLRNLPAWGTVANDDYGRRVIITAPDAQRHLETHRDESLQSTQIRRVFTKIEAWAADSPREVTTAKRNQTRRLKVSLTIDE